jgi:hypothetical protein
MTGLLSLLENKNKAIEDYKANLINKNELCKIIKVYVDEKNKNNKYLYKYGIIKEEEKIEDYLKEV